MLPAPGLVPCVPLTVYPSMCLWLGEMLQNACHRGSFISFYDPQAQPRSGAHEPWAELGRAGIGQRMTVCVWGGKALVLGTGLWRLLVGKGVCEVVWLPVTCGIPQSPQMMKICERSLSWSRQWKLLCFTQVSNPGDSEWKRAESGLK